MEEPRFIDSRFAETEPANALRDGLVLSPAIRLYERSPAWLCASVSSFRPAEGHTGSDHLALVLAPHWGGGTVDGPVFSPEDRVTVRLHSECLLGDVFASSHCDCNHQLRAALRSIEQAGSGVLIYLRQEGRGIGLLDKMRSLAIDHEDTFHRNELVGRPGDMRRYAMAAEVLLTLGVARARLLTGNCDKIDALRSAGIDTETDSRLWMDGVAATAVTEILAKLRRGYVYDLDWAALPPQAR